MTFSSANLPNVAEFPIFPSSLLLLLQLNDYIFVISTSRFSATSEFELTIQRKENTLIYICVTHSPNIRRAFRKRVAVRESIWFSMKISFSKMKIQKHVGWAHDFEKRWKQTIFSSIHKKLNIQLSLSHTLTDWWEGKYTFTFHETEVNYIQFELTIATK